VNNSSIAPAPLAIIVGMIQIPFVANDTLGHGELENAELQSIA